MHGRIRCDPSGDHRVHSGSHRGEILRFAASHRWAPDIFVDACLTSRPVRQNPRRFPSSRHSFRLLTHASRSGSLGRKRRFLLFGSLNVFVTNACLQVLLRIIPIGAATLFSQLINLLLGFVLYGKYVFRVNRLTRRSAVLYAIASAIIWLVNWGGILSLARHGVQRNLAALVMMPLLPLISYGLQRRFVFR